jgi:predicted aspartyl protease
MKTRFDPDAGVILVTALLENDEEVAVLRLALDTGANFSVLTPQVFENMNQNVPPEIERFTLATANGLVEAPLVEIGSLSALGVSRSGFQVAVHPLPDVLDIDGVLGLDFLRNHRLTLDFSAGEIEFN